METERIYALDPASKHVTLAWSGRARSGCA
jgi:hypothetical protein